MEIVSSYKRGDYVISYKKLRFLLVSRRMEFKDLRKALELTPRTVKRLREDGGYVDLETLERICVFFKVDIGDIMEVIYEVPNLF